jgi:hypothetical protein
LNVEPISSPVRALIAEHIESVVDLESLLVFQREATGAWDAADLARELRIDEGFAARELLALARARFIVPAESTSSPPSPSSPRYRYAPATPALDEAVRQLALDYAARRVSVIELIYAKPAAGPLQSFADAFRIRKEPPGG